MDEPISASRAKPDAKNDKLHQYLADYVNEEIERGEAVDADTIKNAFDAYEGGAAETGLNVREIRPIRSTHEVVSEAVGGAIDDAIATGHGEVTLRPNEEYRRIATYWGVAREIAGMTGHPSMEREISIMIKRLGHHEKLDVYAKVHDWFEMALEGSDVESVTKKQVLSAVQHVMDDVELKIKTHRELAGSEDCLVPK